MDMKRKSDLKQNRSGKQQVLAKVGKIGPKDQPSGNAKLHVCPSPDQTVSEMWSAYDMARVVVWYE
jgi:hypothetical protein